MLTVIALIALALGALTGLRALLQPHWIANTLKLQATPDRPGGFAEFRASFGGIFLFLHLFGIYAVLTQGEFHGAIIAATISMGWFGAAVGRILSIILDKEENGTGGINRIWIVLELVIGSMLAAPMVSLHFPAA